MTGFLGEMIIGLSDLTGFGAAVGLATGFLAGCTVSGVALAEGVWLAMGLGDIAGAGVAALLGFVAGFLLEDC